MVKRKRDAASSTTQDRGSSSSSFSSSGWDYEVFLSFRGPDTRKTFTDHLYNALDRLGVRTFRDNEELRTGEKIDAALRSAIHQSKIAIPIFSKGYAWSKWCLGELAEIVECMKQEDERKVTVMPVFYHVDPSDVRKQTGCYEKAFQNHEEKFDKETVEGWKNALKEVGQLKGWEVKNTADGHEGKLIQLIVEEILSKLMKNPLIVSDNLVGIHSHVEEVKKFLNVGSDDIRMVGIHGLGGIGKTTIARCVYNTIHHHFEGCSFIADARENFPKSRRVHLQRQLLIDILNLKNPKITSVDQGINMIRQRLSKKKVLIVVDDVDENTDLNVIIGKRDWFGTGSRIIITTRDMSILDVLGVDETYEPDEMDSDQSLLLFSKHAFRRDQPPEQYLDLSKDVIKTAGGLPLALEVLGSFLVGKGELAWKDTVKKLKVIPNSKVLEKLKISYDGLDRKEKDIFLDIACFLIGMDKDIACYIWDGCDFFPEIGIEVLRQKSLVKIGENNELSMHDQLRDLGREIVCQENFANPGERSRLWFLPEVLDVLSTQRGTSKVEGLCTDFEFGLLDSMGENTYCSLDTMSKDQCSMSEDQCLMSEGFASMTKLRLLQINYARVAGNFVHSFSELRWLSWKECPTKFTPTNLRKLVVLDLSKSLITECWMGWNYIKEAKTLKVLNLSSCYKLSRTPDFSENLHLEILNFECCRNLVTIDESIGHLKRLVSLNLNSCWRLRCLPTSFCELSSLQTLNIVATTIDRWPNSISKLTNLRTLLADNYCDMEEGEIQIGSLYSLNILSLDGKLFHSLPVTVSALSLLQTLSIRRCRNLQSLPELPSSLKDLYASCSGLKSLARLSHLTNLEELDLSDCKDLEEIPSTIDALTRLKSLNLQNCHALRYIPVLPLGLTYLDASECKNLKEILGFSNMRNLVELCVHNCPRLTKIESLEGLDSLQHLDMVNCGSLKKLPKLLGLKNLTHLRLQGIGLSEIEGLEELHCLEKLIIKDCLSLTKIPNMSRLKKLACIEIKGCHELSDIEGCEEGLDSLEKLILHECPSLRKFPNLSCSKNLVRIEITQCRKLPGIEGLGEGLGSLEKLIMKGLHSLRKISNLSCSVNLMCIEITDCHELFEIESIEGLYSLKELIIKNCHSLRKIPNFSNSKNLLSINISSCNELSEIEVLEDLEAMREFSLLKLDSIIRLPYLLNLKALKDLQFWDLKMLRELPSVDKLESLENLEVAWCKSIERLPDLSNLTKLRELCIHYCEKLTEIQGVDRLENLELLRIDGCISIETLPCLSNLKNLQNLSSINCKKLTKIQGVDKLESLTGFCIDGCISIEALPCLSSLMKLQNLSAVECKKLTEIQGVDFNKLVVRGCISMNYSECAIRDGDSFLAPDLGLEISDDDSSLAPDLEVETTDDDSPLAIEP